MGDAGIGKEQEGEKMAVTPGRLTYREFRNKVPSYLLGDEPRPLTRASHYEARQIFVTLPGLTGVDVVAPRGGGGLPSDLSPGST